MDQRIKSYIEIVGVVIGCLIVIGWLAAAFASPFYVLMRKDSKGRQYNLWQRNKEFLIPLYDQYLTSAILSIFVEID